MLEAKKIEVFLIAVGSTFEWFDYIIYLSLSPYLSHIFFPNDSVKKGMFFVFLIFAVAYVARPIGGVMLGSVADKLGRKKTFLISTGIMAISSLGIACLPGYSSIGPFSFVLLLTFRLLQAYSVGGEYTVGVAYLSEKSASHRGLVSSFFIFSTILGVLLAYLFSSWLKASFSHSEITAWAWRIPFFISFIFVLLNVFFRSALTPSEVFCEMRDSIGVLKRPLASVLRDQKKLILLIMLYAAFPEVSVYSYMVMMPTFISKYSGMNYNASVMFHILPLSVLVVAIPFFGALSDKIGRIKQYAIAVFLFTFLSFISAFVFKYNPHNIVLIMTTVVFLGFALAAICSPLPATLAEQIKTRTRCSAFGIGYNLSAAVFGGTTPLVAQYLADKNNYFFGTYLVLVLILSIIGVSFFKDKRLQHIDHE